MGKIADWFDIYFREVGFVVVTGFIIFVLCCGADMNPVNGSIYDTFGQIMLTAVFCFGVVGLGQNADTAQRAGNLQLFSAFYLLLILFGMIAYSCYVQQTFAATDSIKLGCCGVVCAVFCGWYLDYRRKELEKWDYLRENRPDEYLRELIRKKRLLNVEQQLKLFYLADAEDLLFQYMQSEEIAESTENRLLEEPFALNLLKHLPKYHFTNTGDARMFVMDNAPQLVAQYVQNGNAFSAENALKMFDLPNADEVVAVYIDHSYLPDECEMRMFDLPNAQELVTYYEDKYGLCEMAKEKAKEKGWI